MTELLTRPPAASTPVTGSSDQQSIWWRGALAALWSVALGVAALIVLVLIVWATDPRSGASAAQAIRGALQLWLAAHKVPLHVGASTLAVAPLGLTLGVAFLVARAAAVLARGRDVDTTAGIVTVGLAVGVPYAVLAAFVAAAANGAPVRPSPVAAMTAGLLVGFLAATWGAARGTGRLTALVRRLPAGGGESLIAGAMAVGVLFVAGILLVLAALAVHAQTAADLTHVLGGGAVPGIALLVADALLLPNAAAAAVGYLAGPGFAVGAGTSVSLAGAHVGAVPSLPLLAALPHGAAPTGVRICAVLLILAAGGVAGWWVSREVRDGSLRPAVTRALGAAAAAGVIAAVLVAVAGGPGGPGRMSAVGASPWQVGLVLFGEVGFVGGLVAVLVAWSRRSTQ